MSVQEPTHVRCPYCGEIIDVCVDLSGGSQSYIEDCQVCCCPIQLAIHVAPDGSVQIDAVSGDE